MIDDYLKLTLAARLDFINEMSRRSGMAPAVLEKDYWVTWTLQHLFSLPEVAPHLIFKGGTSLSKVYGAIHRFSEDIDISINRAALGFGGEAEPEAGPSKGKREDRCKALAVACTQMIHGKLLPALQAAFEKDLGSNKWSLSVSEKSPNDLIFTYPSVASAVAYVAQSVLIEMGPYSDHEPHETHTVAPLFSEYIDKGTVELVSATVVVLAAERTFWEKATLLHSTYYQGAAKLKSRYARHYYDLSQLSRMNVTAQALGDARLLQRVVEHKKFYYRSAASKYDLATPGTFKLVPEGDLLAAILVDYKAMGDMFFDAPPPFDLILENLRELENRINALPVPRTDASNGEAGTK